jgi:hypothetical protein
MTNANDDDDDDKNYRIRYSVCFGEERPRCPDLLGMRIVEYFITGDKIVPFHAYVASRQRFCCVLLQHGMPISSVNPREYDALQFVNADGRKQEFAFTEFTISIQSGSPNTKVDWFPCQEFNDTAFVFFGSGGDDDTAVRAALRRPVGWLVYLFQAYERFRGYAGLIGPTYLDTMVPWKEFPPTTRWKSSFPRDVCLHPHSLMFWANSPVQETALEDGVLRFTDADGHTITMSHRTCNDNERGSQWTACYLGFHDAFPERLGFQMAMPFALTAPFQVSFPGCELPGEAAAQERQRIAAARLTIQPPAECNH